MKKLLGVIVLAGLSVAGYLMFTGPRMRVQPSIREWQMAMPPSPAGAVPLAQVVPTVPTAKQAAALRQPLPASAENIAIGRTYYEYYCLACHGAAGDGHGPVGESYFPTPSDLRTQKIKSMPEGVLLRAMLSGQGHEPVLPRVVPEKAWWYLVLYMKSL